MRAYIAINYSKRKFLQKELDAIGRALALFSFKSFVFVDSFSYSLKEEKEMMQHAFEEIDTSELIIAEHQIKQ